MGRSAIVLKDDSAGDPLRATVQVKDRRAWLKLLKGSGGLGEGYIDGLWETDDLLSLLRIGARRLARTDRIGARLLWPRALAHRLLRRVPRNTRSGARRHIAAHYDLGNDLFESFLDSRMQYSCAIYKSDAETGSPQELPLDPVTASEGLEQAQLDKLERICGVLDLKGDDHLVEIGTGWGGLAIHAAENHGCKVTTTTISREQRRLAAERVRRAGLSDSVALLESDYRDLTGRFDKLVSVEMIEAVGWQYFDLFFRRCADLLRPGGRMLLQAITLPPHLYRAEKTTRTFANTYVFPGGCLPSESVIASSSQRAGLRILDIHQISSSYAPTLSAWRHRFIAAWDSRLAGRYDERFKRLWRFYLAYCEAGFRESRIGDVQILLEKARPYSPAVNET